MGLADEMQLWEVHALRNLVAVMLQAVALLSSFHNTDEAQYTPEGVFVLCQEAYQEFERHRFLAMKDPHFRRTFPRQ